MKKIIFITLLILIFLIGFQVAFAGTIIQNYPDIPGAKKPGEGDPGQELPQLIQYIFRFSLGLVGIVGILALIFAAFGYLTSVGDPAKAASAKQRIVSALLGILLLLSSYILLKIVNPDLLKLKLEEKPIVINVEPSEEGGCLLTQAGWDKSRIKTGESATFILYLNEKCKGQTINATHKLELRQLESRERDTNYSRFCGKLSRESIDSLKLKVVCVFKGFDNEFNNQPEKFYMKGWFQIYGKPKQYIPETFITVEDGK